VIERILRGHQSEAMVGGLWEGPLRNNASVRAPPGGSHQVTAAPSDPQFVPDSEFLEFEYRQSQAEATRELQLVLDPDFL
jgi:hypothetical protein